MQRTIRVHYPAGDDIVLRTDRDWERSLDPDKLLDDGKVRTFLIDDVRPTVYFKPLRRRNGEEVWSHGANYGCGPGGRGLFPSFDEGQGDISDILTVGPCRLRLYLPPGYHENTLKHYPVVYMHDGGNLFFPEESFTGVDWRVDKTLDDLAQMQLVDKLIVVAVYAGENRNEIYTKPGYKAYADELLATVLAYVNGSYRTLTGPDNTASVGSSLGGVVSFYLAWDRPEVFGKAGCFSSTFGWRDDLLERVLNEDRRSVRFYLDSGWPGDNYERNRAMRDALGNAGYLAGTDFLHFAFPGAEHHESAWADRLHLPFQFLFGSQFRTLEAG